MFDNYNRTSPKVLWWSKIIKTKLQKNTGLFKALRLFPGTSQSTNRECNIERWHLTMAACCNSSRYLLLFWGYNSSIIIKMDKVNYETMRPNSSMWTVLWTFQMMIQTVENDSMDPIENMDTNNCVLATVSTEINKDEPVHQSHTPIRYTSN